MNIATVPPNVSSHTGPAPPLNNRLEYIDGLRGLAMLMVLLFHCWAFTGYWQVNVPCGDRDVNIAFVLGFGHVGVNLFLVLSGFCLYWPFVRKGRGGYETTLWQYAKRRCRRILPPYYATIFLCAGIALFYPLQGEVHTPLYLFEWFWWHFFMLHNTQPEYNGRLNGSLWSLGLEFHLYLLFPILVEAFKRLDKRNVLFTVLLISSAYRYLVIRTLSPEDMGFFMYLVFGRCFEFVCGMYIASVIHEWNAKDKPPLRWSDYLLFGTLVGIAFTQEMRSMTPSQKIWHEHHFLFTDALWGLLFSALTIIASRPHTLVNRLLSSRVFTSLGTISYSVYLLHLPLLVASGVLVKQHHLSNEVTIFLELLVVIPVILGISYGFHVLFERPFMHAPRPRHQPAILSSAAPKVLADR